jgi:sporulation protein YlmC with PRC-barrel domain
MRDSSTEMANRLDLVYWAHMESREAITIDGRMVGIVRGILIDPTTWTIPLLVVEARKGIMEELNIEKPLQSSLVTIPTSYVKSISDVVELNTDLASMGGTVKIFIPREHRLIAGYHANP